MAITKAEIERARARTKRYALSDEHGLLLIVHPTGKKTWVVRYRLDGKEHRKQIGEFPTLELKDAREIAEQMKGQARRGELQKIAPEDVKTFREVAEDWLKKTEASTGEAHYKKQKCRLKHLDNAIGEMKINEIKAVHILEIAENLQKQGKTDTAHRICSVAVAIFDSAMRREYIVKNPAYNLWKELERHTKKHYKAITEEPELKTLMQLINRYRRPITRIALLFSALTFARPGEVCHAEWSEIDWEACEWRISAKKMKKERPHIVPLSDQAIELLHELKRKTKNKGGAEKWLFPSTRGDGRPMSEGTVLTALLALGYNRGEITAHGFRTTASTILNENEYNFDFIEKQLSHDKDTNNSREAYNRAKWIKQRQRMMQWWSDYLWDLMTDRIKNSEELAELLKSDEERRWDNDNLLTEEELYIKYNPPSEDEED